MQRSLAQHVPADEESLAGPDMIAALEARDLLNRLQGALMRLNPKTREIFLAHRVDGVSYSDIAKRMGLSVKGVE
ncbi:sigma factor-like helix-turn-helix DNA-binding protein, partial [Acinetobacter baumannii]